MGATNTPVNLAWTKETKDNGHIKWKQSYSRSLVYK